MTSSPLMPRELDHRSADGVSVTLFWDPGVERAIVSVHDARRDESHEIHVRPDERALDVFRHPFAYVAARARTPLVARLTTA